MVCSKCSGTNINISVNTNVVSKNRSCLWNLFMIFITAGFWIIWMLVRKRKEKLVTQKVAVCQSCGHSWNI